MSENIDLDYRPETYWPEALDQEQLLAKIQGATRREIARKILAEHGFAGLGAFFAREQLDDEERAYWGALHPDCMGGEYLPALAPGEVEIARISLASVTHDQITIRATHAGKKIRYAVYDEYETGFVLTRTESGQPLTLGELIALIDGSSHPEEPDGGGLLVCHWEHMHSYGEDLETAVDFARIESAWYPQLADHYREVGNDWFAEKSREQAAEEDEDPDDHGSPSGRAHVAELQEA